MILVTRDIGHFNGQFLGQLSEPAATYATGTIRVARNAFDGDERAKAPVWHAIPDGSGLTTQRAHVRGLAVAIEEINRRLTLVPLPLA